VNALRWYAGIGAAVGAVGLPIFLYLDDLSILHGFPSSGTLDQGNGEGESGIVPGPRAR